MQLGQRWVRLFLLARLAATVVAGVLLTVPRGGHEEPVLAALGLAWGAATAAAAWRRPELFVRPLAWLLDAAAALALVVASDDWRGPFYLLALTTLAAPAAALPPRRALPWGVGFTVAYGAVASATGLDADVLDSRSGLDTLATHLLLPLVATAGATYTADAMRRLRAEQSRAERLAIETERRRLAWELHDSAKQRLHAAALMLSTVETPGEMVGAAMQEVQGATLDLESSIAELQSPLEDRPLDQALRARAGELQRLTGAEITVSGFAPALPAVTATHVYRIVAEALSNAVRHAEAGTIEIRLQPSDGGLVASVSDDGRGLPQDLRPGASGFVTMRSRAFAIGARLTVEAGPGERGTRVRLDLPSQTGAHPR